MIRSIAIAGALALGLCGPAATQPIPPAQPPGPRTEALPTPDFLDAAAQSDQFEIKEGRLAAMRGADRRIERAGAEMAREHGRSTRLMAAAVRKAGLPPVTQPGLDIGQQQMFERLKATTGSAFDSLYVDQQVQAHREALAMMSGYIRAGEPGPIRQAAIRIKPVVARHLAMFESLQGGVR